MLFLPNNLICFGIPIPKVVADIKNDCNVISYGSFIWIYSPETVPLVVVVCIEEFGYLSSRLRQPWIVSLNALNASNPETLLEAVTSYVPYP